MRQIAEALLQIENIMKTLLPEEQEQVSFHVSRHYGGSVKHVSGHVSKTPETPVFHVGGDDGGVNPVVSKAVRRNPEVEAKALEVLQFLNIKASRSFRPVEENLRFIRARLSGKNRCSVEDLKGVIALKTREWKNTKQEVFLRPKTLFNATNFEQYLGERPSDV